MASPRRSVPWPYVGLGLLAVLTLVLVGLALREPAPPPATVAVGQSPAPEASAEATGTAGPTDAAEPSPTTDIVAPQAAPPGRERPLAALSSRAALRGVAGTCPGGGAELELTDDQGQSWQPVATPTDMLLRVQRTSESQLWFVGADGRRCTPEFSISDDRGQSWVGPSDSTGAWHQLVDVDATQLRAPYSLIDSPCGRRGVLELEAVSFEEASVLCGNGEVFSTINSGTAWTSVGRTAGAVAMGLLGSSPVVALVSEGDCSGLAIGAPGGDAVGCVQGAPSSGVALAFNGPAAGWVLAGEQTWTSNDAGSTWKRRQ
jgi:hypothetical protein